ncbi:hypothetical protein [Salinactinospora qingdaonensis]|uniref:hypothetical protein n=1 Tax=Salinactinospora qingdaonensis TaxID=702744 RepID=UPI0031E7A385
MEIAKRASELLDQIGKHGHQHAIDAVVAATALSQPGPVILVTSDVDDMSQLCDERVMIKKV